MDGGGLGEGEGMRIERGSQWGWLPTDWESLRGFGVGWRVGDWSGGLTLENQLVSSRGNP